MLYNLGPFRRTAGLRWASTEDCAATIILVSELRDLHRNLLEALYHSIQAIDGRFGHRTSRPTTNNVCNFKCDHPDNHDWSVITLMIGIDYGLMTPATCQHALHTLPLHFLSISEKEITPAFRGIEHQQPGSLYLMEESQKAIGHKSCRCRKGIMLAMRCRNGCKHSRYAGCQIGRSVVYDAAPHGLPQSRYHSPTHGERDDVVTS